jgi:hypothetical protein
VEAAQRDNRLGGIEQLLAALPGLHPHPPHVTQL